VNNACDNDSTFDDGEDESDDVGDDNDDGGDDARGCRNPLLANVVLKVECDAHKHVIASPVHCAVNTVNGADNADNADEDVDVRDVLFETSGSWFRRRL
jgi:hypothetical protein